MLPLVRISGLSVNRPIVVAETVMSESAGGRVVPDPDLGTEPVASVGRGDASGPTECASTRDFAVKGAAQ